MARENYLIEGLSGTGKSSVCAELIKRGYHALDADEVFGYFADPESKLPTDSRSQLNWIWNVDKVSEVLEDKTEDKLYVCGGSMNQEEFAKHFLKVFTLAVDDNTLRNRLLGRTNSSFGKEPSDLDRQLNWNKGVRDYSKQRGTILVDATKPLKVVVDSILSKS